MGRPSYQQQTSQRGHQARGLDQGTQQSLHDSNLLRARPSKKKKTRAPKPQKEEREPPAVKRSEADAVDLPRRSRRKIPRQSRHFRLPLAVDDKLLDIVNHYDASMVWVLSKMVQEEWVRIKRKERRAAKEREPDDLAVEADAADDREDGSSGEPENA